MGRRRDFEMKDEILEALEKFPHNSSQLSKRLDTSQEAVENHLQDLRDYGKVYQTRQWVNGNEKKLWKLTE